jgi:hypothetical protein
MIDLKRKLEISEERIAAWTLQANKLRNKITEQQSVGGVKQWSPVGGDWWIDGSGEVEEVDTSFGSQEFGVERPTQQQAERASVEMRKFNRLLALRDELCGDDVVNWDSEGPKYYLCCYEENKTWDVDTSFRKNNNAVYFTTRQSAQRACDMLNIGEVVL